MGIIESHSNFGNFVGENFWRVVQSEFLQRVLGISLKPKPRRNAPVTSPKVFEHAIAYPRMLPVLLKHTRIAK